MRDGDKIMVLTPGIGSLYSIEIDFFSSLKLAASQQKLTFFRVILSVKLLAIWTFGFLHEVNALRAGFGFGWVFGQCYCSRHRFCDESRRIALFERICRHKVLDGLVIYILRVGLSLGSLRPAKPGHNMNNLVLRELFFSP